MKDRKQALSDPAREIKEQAAEKLNDLINKADKLSETLEQKAGEVWEKLKSGQAGQQMEDLKKRADEKLDQLVDESKKLWNKISSKPHQ
jgi:hypothetical protein